jgi:hypothetical protein
MVKEECGLNPWSIETSDSGPFGSEQNDNYDPNLGEGTYSQEWENGEIYDRPWTESDALTAALLLSELHRQTSQ